MSDTSDDIGKKTKSTVDGTKKAAHDADKKAAQKVDDLANVNSRINDK